MLAGMAAEEYQRAEAAWVARAQALAHAGIDRELEHAAAVQRRLLPADLHLPGLDLALGFEPCRWVGGDYVDAVPTRDARVLLVIADVCGKGLPAALVASSLHTAIHAGLRAGIDPAQLPQILNEHLREVLSPGRFVTLSAVLLDPQNGTTRCANFGHPPPVLLNQNGKLRALSCGDHLPLGLDALQVQWEPDRLDAGQLLAMYTDGLPELANAEGKMLGYATLRDMLRTVYMDHPGQPAQKLATNLSQALAAYRGASLDADDRTFLLLQRQG
jgi:serine phosphatase RsbU (regulator of sigma subunit)